MRRNEKGNLIFPVRENHSEKSCRFCKVFSLRLSYFFIEVLDIIIRWIDPAMSKAFAIRSKKTPYVTTLFG